MQTKTKTRVINCIEFVAVLVYFTVTWYIILETR